MALQRNNRALRKQQNVLNNRFSSGAKEAKKDVEEVVKTLNKLLKKFDEKEIKKLLRPAADILTKAAQANIHDSEVVHYRHLKDSKTKYYPGNLRKSIKVLSLRKTNSLFVGPGISKGGGGKVFGKGKRVDGWYAHFQEYGTINMPTPRNLGFMRRAYIANKNKIIGEIFKQVKNKVKEYERENSK